MMAITPQQAAEISPSDLEEVDRLEVAVDNRLRETGRGAILSIRGLSRRVVEELQRRYRHAGWHVTLKDDQREGAYLHFRPAGAPCGAGRE